jgi:two-component system sensor kinase FixL
VAVVTTLAGSIAHELRQPLTAIGANANAALRLLDSSRNLAPARAAIADIVVSCRRAGALVDSSYKLVKKGTHTFSDVELMATLAETAGLVQDWADSRSIRLHANLPDRPTMVAADRLQLQQVVLNLLLNACDAVAGMALHHRRVELTAQVSNGRALVTVADDGPGVRDEHLGKLFEPFFTTKPHGLGLGLSISQGIISAHGGTLTAERRPSGGMLFSFSLAAR